MSIANVLLQGYEEMKCKTGIYDHLQKIEDSPSRTQYSERRRESYHI